MGKYVKEHLNYLRNEIVSLCRRYELEHDGMPINFDTVHKLLEEMEFEMENGVTMNHRRRELEAEKRRRQEAYDEAVRDAKARPGPGVSGAEGSSWSTDGIDLDWLRKMAREYGMDEDFFNGPFARRKGAGHFNPGGPVGGGPSPGGESYKQYQERVMGKTPNAWFNILGVNPTASKPEIKAAYQKKVLSAHPDKGGSVEKFKSLFDVGISFEEIDCHGLVEPLFFVSCHFCLPGSLIYETFSTNI